MYKFKLDLTGKKLQYNIEELSDELISNKIKELKLEENISEIRLGRAAQLLLKDSKYNLVQDDMFEPVCADSEVNPVLHNGRRLSSYILYIINNNELIKLIPRNLKRNLAESK